MKITKTLIVYICDVCGTEAECPYVPEGWLLIPTENQEHNRHLCSICKSAIARGIQLNVSKT